MKLFLKTGNYEIYVWPKESKLLELGFGIINPLVTGSRYIVNNDVSEVLTAIDYILNELGFLPQGELGWISNPEAHIINFQYTKSHQVVSLDRYNYGNMDFSSISITFFGHNEKGLNEFLSLI